MVSADLPESDDTAETALDIEAAAIEAILALIGRAGHQRAVSIVYELMKANVQLEPTRELRHAERAEWLDRHARRSDA